MFFQQQNRDCLRDGPPEKGEHVSILWTDGDVYGATFRGVNKQDLYTVEFEDGSQLQAKRDELWGDHDDIPKSILNKVVCTIVFIFFFFFFFFAFIKITKSN